MSLALFQQTGPVEILVLFLFGLWIWALIDIVRRSDLSSRTKAIWVVALFMFVFATAVIYFIVKMVSEKPIPDFEPMSGE